MSSEEIEIGDLPIKTTLAGTDILHIQDSEDSNVDKSILAELFIGATTDGRTKVSANDATVGYLNGKLVAGTNISLVEGNDGGNETLTINNTQSIIGGLYSNAIINGNLLIDQYSTADGTDMATATYPIDMFRTNDDVVTSPKYYKITTSQPATLPQSNSIKLIAQANESTKFIMFGQQIEDYKQFYSKVVTMSCWVKSNSVNARLLNYDGSTYTSSTAHTGGGAWELLTVTRTMGAAITSINGWVALATVAGAGVEIATNEYIELTGMQLTVGSARQAENPLSYDEELRRCQRYYYAIWNDSNNQPIGYGINSSISFANIFVKMPYNMYTKPTLIQPVALTDILMSNGSAGIALTTFSLLTSLSGSDAVTLLCTVSAGLTAQAVIRLEFTAASKRIAFDANL